MWSTKPPPPLGSIPGKTCRLPSGYSGNSFLALDASANGQESAKIVGMLIATKIFADRIGRIEVSATMAVTAEAARLRAQGAHLVDFGAGEPHFATPRHIKDAAIAAIEGNFTRYTVVAGIPELRKAIVQRHACDFGSDYAPDETVFTTGGKLASLTPSRCWLATATR